VTAERRRERGDAIAADRDADLLRGQELELGGETVDAAGVRERKRATLLANEP